MSSEEVLQPSRNVLHWVRQRELTLNRPRGGRAHGAPLASGRDVPVLPVDTDPGQRLGSFVECDFLRRCAATYCELTPPPRSTIAAAFSPDGSMLASTQGTRQTEGRANMIAVGRCCDLVLLGHRRTPWVVCFHPTSPRILASGSLDYEVRVWDAEAGDCSMVWSFGRPIASLSFHAGGDYLAVASGHKLYMWEYNKPGAVPVVILKTRRSLRAVHFRPHGAPYLLTAEVSDPSPNTELPLPFDHSMKGPPAVPRAAAASAERPSEAISQLLGEAAAPAATAPPSNLTPSLAQAQSYSAAQQILGLTQRAAQQSGAVAQPPRQRGAPAALAEGLPPAVGPPSPPNLNQPPRPPPRPASPGAQPYVDPNSPPNLYMLRATVRGQPYSHPSSPPNLNLLRAAGSRQPNNGQPPINAFAGWWPWQTTDARGAEQAGALPGHTGVSTLDLRSRAARPAEVARASRSRSGAAGGYRRFRDSRPPMPAPPGSFPPSPPRVRAGRSITPDALDRAAEGATEQEPGGGQQRAWSVPAACALEREALRRRQAGPAAAQPPPPAAVSTAADQLFRAPASADGRPVTPDARPVTPDAPPGWRWWEGSNQQLGVVQPVQGMPVAALQFGTLPMLPGQHMAGWQQLPRAVASPRVPSNPAAFQASQQQQQQAQGHRGDQELRHWPPPRGWVDPHFMTRLYQRNRAPPGAAGMLPPLFGQGVTRSFSEPHHSLVDVLEQGWMGPGGHAPGQPQPPPNAAAVAPLPPSMVNMGWEYPAQLLQQSAARLAEAVREPGHAAESAGRGGRQPVPTHADASAVRESAAAANAIGQEQPCRVKLRLWRYSPYDSASPKQAGAAAAPAPKKRAESAASSATTEQGGAHVAVEAGDGAAQPMNIVPPSPVAEAAQAGTVAQGAQQGSLRQGGGATARPSAAAPPSASSRRPAADPAASAVAMVSAATSATAAAAPGPSRRPAADAAVMGAPVASGAISAAATSGPPRPLECTELTIMDAVLCSEMGVHFSPCGRYLAVCVACQGPPDTPVVYEVRVYSMLHDSLGTVLAAKAIRAAHCLTSIQFSPSSEHILLAYGRRHISLLRSLVADAGASVIPVHTVMEVYRVAAGMPLVRVLPSARDEVNAAAFHPFKGGGIAYGTKEGRLRILRHAACAPGSASSGPDARGDWRSLVDELVEADQVAAAAAIADLPSSDDDA
ncbi:probable activating molecule in BECN1-regulated autophagy protein 1 at N-terminal half [Coccomyxa sp. Obi]|nr:probable activating molecule in BECN1-regulated autophagy protein 1 at N-terminal half [Coccomyxa sp. Obi]